jgi:catechol-2,3-dioxygenase
MALTHLLVVADLAESTRWYQQVLGAEPFSEYEGSSVLSFNGVWLLLVEGAEQCYRAVASHSVDATPLACDACFRG